MDFGKGVSNIVFSYSAPEAGKFVDFKVAEPGVGNVSSATAITTISTVATGGWEKTYMQTTATTECAPVTGVMDLYVQLRVPSGSGLNMMQADISIIR